MIPSFRLRNEEEWWGLARRLFRTKSVMARLWDHHFGHLCTHQKIIGSRIPDLPFFHRMHRTLHPFWQKIIERSKKRTSQQVLRNENQFSQKNTKAKMTALARSIHFKPRWTIFIENSIKYKGLGKQMFFIMHPYFWVWYMHQLETGDPEWVYWFFAWGVRAGLPARNYLYYYTVSFVIHIVWKSRRYLQHSTSERGTIGFQSKTRTE